MTEKIRFKRVYMKIKYIISLSAILLVSACSGVSDQLGLKRQAPDEFAIVKRAPLQLPPNYNLRPPQPGAVRPQEGTTTEAAKTSVLGTEERIFNAGESKGEKGLLSKIGAGAAQPDIREVLSEESGIIVDDQRTVAEKLLFLEGSSKTPEGDIIDPVEESKRLKDDQPNAEETETIIEKR